MNLTWFASSYHTDDDVYRISAARAGGDPGGRGSAGVLVGITITLGRRVPDPVGQD
jgi:hypothetical protein